ncbi:hypothetical protein BGZ99_003241 [Dissophora globulifera]|uniref:Uncharacterized protein n=1 Tax=Dissophora globulifera TaxID=979702 RepID=A0A9P6RQM3_9FUNG|nr:hypothetical protein BGZ99_003241 [Dissophora globulifera]
MQVDYADEVISFSIDFRHAYEITIKLSVLKSFVSAAENLTNTDTFARYKFNRVSPEMLLRFFATLAAAVVTVHAVGENCQGAQGLNFPGIATLTSSWCAKNPSAPLTEACKPGGGGLQLRLALKGFNGLANGICDIDLESTVPQYCPDTFDSASFGSVRLGQPSSVRLAVVNVTSIPNAKQVSASLQVVASGSMFPPKFQTLVGFPAGGHFSKRWDVNKSINLDNFICPTQ